MNNNSQLPDTYKLSQVPVKLLLSWRSLLLTDTKNSREQANELYFKDILPIVLKILDEQPNIIKLRKTGYHTLVSLMGLSPETTIIATHAIHPQRLAIVYDKDTSSSYDRAHNLLSDKMLKHSQIKQVEIDPINCSEMYIKIKEWIINNYQPGVNSTHKHIVDITGGKKIMSATAAQTAWELDTPLCYIDGKYDKQLRRPIPGTENVMCINDPSHQKGMNKQRTALQFYNRRNYITAIDAFEESKKLNENRILEDIALTLCPCYVAWADLDLVKLKEHTIRLKRCLEEPPVERRVNNNIENPKDIIDHVDALQAVAEGDFLALLASYLELANLYKEQKRNDFSCLLAYRAMEAFVEYRLKQIGGSEFSVSKPNYALLPDTEEELRNKYIKLSEKSGSNENTLPEKISFLIGIKLLCVVDNLHKKSQIPDINFVKKMRGQAQRRNESVLAHGKISLTDEDSLDMLNGAEKLAKIILNSDECIKLNKLRTKLAPIELEKFKTKSQ